MYNNFLKIPNSEAVNTSGKGEWEIGLCWS